MTQSLKTALHCFTLLATLITLSACGFPDKNIDPIKNNAQEHRKDMKDCAEAYTETPSGGYLKQRISCMELKGWR